MTKLTTTLIGLLALVTLNVTANETETKIETALEQRIEQLSKSLVKFQEMKAAIKREGAADRNTTLRKVTARMRRDTASVTTALDSLDFYLEVQQLRKSDTNELNTTQDSISMIKDQIKGLKQVMIATHTPATNVATK